jgi:hypothetical protein
VQNFAGANLEGAHLGNADMSRANFYKAQLFQAKFRLLQIEGPVGLTQESFRGSGKFNLPKDRILEKYPDQAESAYRRLALYFSANGLLDAASWASYRGALMNRQILQKRLSRTNFMWERFAEGGFNRTMSNPFIGWPLTVAWIVNILTWIKSTFFLLLIGYGEKPFRAIANACAAILLYALIYLKVGGLNETGFRSALYFSTITFSTVGYGDLAPKPAFRLIAASEGLIGIFLCGLFLFCLGRRSVGRS